MSPQNPFASVRVRPGAMPFLFRDAIAAPQLVDRLRENHWRGQIIGPHGTGKSSLLRTLIPLLRDAGRDVVYIFFRGGVMRDEWHRRLAGEGAAPARRRCHWNSSTQVIIDGFEQASWLARWRWRLACRWRRCGLLVTAHRDLGLPMLHETHVDEELAQRVADGLLGAERELVTCDDVAAALAEQRGNLRDALFQLYDLYESKRSRI